MDDQIPTIEGEPLFNPSSPNVIANPYPYYDRLRRVDPMHLAPLGFYVASRHAEVSAVLRDKRFGNDFISRVTRRFGAERANEPAYRIMGHWMIHQEPADHARLRGLVAQAFTARRVEEMRPHIQEMVDGLIDRVEAQGHMDIIEDFAFPLPATVICDMLGIPVEDRAVFFESARIGGRLLDPVALTPAEMEQHNAEMLTMAEYFEGLFQRRQREPGDDLTTHLVQAEQDGDKLSSEELAANIIFLFWAGHETTVNLIGNGLLALYRNPDQLQLLRDDPRLGANAIEELLRYDSSVQVTSRTALEVIDDLGGVRIEKGQPVVCLLGSANRDPAVYQDPERLDITRSNVRPLSFGGGIHYCLGAQLARIEGEIAIGTLLRRLPELRLDNIDTPAWRPTFLLRGVEKLPASW
jgi:cytochrome P450